MASTTTPAAATTTLRHASSAEPSEDDARHSSLLRRSWYAMSDVLSPFSPSALASLPKKTFQIRPRYTRVDHIPDAEQDEDGQMPTVRDYHAINSVPPQVRVPKKIATPVKVEGKVWFANERSTSQGTVLWDASLNHIANHSVGSVPSNLGAHRHIGPGVIQYVERQHSSQSGIRIRGLERSRPGMSLHFNPFTVPLKHTVVVDLWICGIPA